MKRPIALILLGMLLLLGLGFGWGYPFFLRKWRTPLGARLALPTSTATPRVTLAVQVATVHPTLPDQTQTTAAPTPIATPTPAPLCGAPPLLYILAIGADSGESYTYGLADAIRVVRVDFVTPKVTALTFPRDLWVEIPEINTKYNITHGKLNQAYFYGNKGMGYYQGEGEGPGLLARTLQHNFGLRVDHYGAINMNTFVKLVDAVGGIDIYLPEDVDGTSEDPSTVDLGYFPAGQHHFTGEEALRFARIRKKYNDFVRQDHQTMVLCALRAKLKEPAVLARLPQIITAFQGSVQTDLSPEQLMQLACLLPHLKRENILFASFPPELLPPSWVYNPFYKKTTFAIRADPQALREYVEKFMAGTWPDQPEEPACP
ncbi:MAG: LCP family protein [Anaerolineales bacterium]|nr:LCP family protein [Anaerolineales bacterium]MDW8162727.1 LCP family protein [Anaerolineales bacterium]